MLSIAMYSVAGLNQRSIMTTNISPRRPANGKQVRADRTRAMLVDETVRGVLEEGSAPRAPSTSRNDWVSRPVKPSWSIFNWVVSRGCRNTSLGCGDCVVIVSSREEGPGPPAPIGQDRQVMADRFAVWNEITGATTTAAA
jgi:hypothetical protein